MAELGNELMFEILRSIQDRLSKLDGKMDEVKGELTAIRTYIYAEPQDIGNIYGVLARQDARLDRIERRLELREAEPA